MIFTYEVDGDKTWSKYLKTLLNEDSEVRAETMCQTNKHVKLWSLYKDI